MDHNDESLTIRVPVVLPSQLTNGDRVRFQNFVHAAAVEAAGQWIAENTSSGDNAPAGLIPKAQARAMYHPKSRSQVIVDEIYKGGTRNQIINRVKAHPVFADKKEEQFIPNYVSHIMNKVRRDVR